MLKGFAIRRSCIIGSQLWSHTINRMNGTETHENGVVTPCRGALIILEGCDRTGKTTQAQKLVESLNASGKPATFMRFPDRTTKIGSIIDSYLACSSELEDHSIHLLFSANRWELLPKITSTLLSGTSVIIDRYAFSGVAFSAAKEGMSLEWCKQSDIGLPKPDRVLFLDLSMEEAQRRGQYGEERYEKAEFQKRVNENYRLLRDESWKVIDANKTVEALQKELVAEVLNVIGSIDGVKIGKLWV
ncbi:thymidylate kinase-like [Palaemon carinicauda]|uniref:thymidylate kinase-like n=1 Tax=Palaemon carinicauda TaxID=392227 RepID=UPI0035B64B9A